MKDKKLRLFLSLLSIIALLPPFIQHIFIFFLCSHFLDKMRIKKKKNLGDPSPLGRKIGDGVQPACVTE